MEVATGYERAGVAVEVSTGNETTLPASVTEAKQKPMKQPALISSQPRSVEATWWRKSTRATGGVGPYSVV